MSKHPEWDREGKWGLRWAYFLGPVDFYPTGRDMAGAGLEQDPLTPGTLSLWPLDLFKSKVELGKSTLKLNMNEFLDFVLVAWWTNTNYHNSNVKNFMEGTLSKAVVLNWGDFAMQGHLTMSTDILVVTIEGCYCHRVDRGCYKIYCDAVLQDSPRHKRWSSPKYH